MFALALLLLTPEDDIAATRDALVSRCAIPVERILIEPDPASDALIATIRGADPLSDAQLDCFGAVLAGRMMVSPSFEDEALDKRYRYVTGRSTLARMGLLDRLPVFDRTRDTLPGFARKLELLCKARPGSMLEATETNIHIRMAALNTSTGKFDRVICVIDALNASGFDPFRIVEPVPVDVPTIP